MCAKKIVQVFITSSNYSKNRRIGKENISLAFYYFSYNQFHVFYDDTVRRRRMFHKVYNFCVQPFMMEKGTRKSGKFIDFAVGVTRDVVLIS